MSELLSPAGTVEAFHVAISNGANAIYLGLDRFSARAYANNFTLDSLKPLLDFAHLRNVKIYVTINTIIFDDELDDVYKTLDELAKMGVDGIIIQDLAVAHYITSHYSSLNAHASTQMGVDDLDAATLLKSLGFKRVVFARETPIETIKNIKNKLNIEVEAFIHGALCVSYSGNCYMSSAIGERSGNRGRCAGCCRKYYTLIDLDDKTKLKEGYLLSMKDLNTSTKIQDMSFIDSLKIEGRMKEPNYVASVTRIYRQILDGEPFNKENLDKVFNRTYTLGFMNGQTSADITNIEKPNNYGYYIGNVIKQNKSTIWVRLNRVLNKGDQVRIETNNLKNEISVPVLKLFDANFNSIESSDKIAIFTCEDKVDIGAKVYKTKDINFVREADKTILKNEYKKIKIDVEFVGKLNKPIFLKVICDKCTVYVKSAQLIISALTQPTTKQNIINQLSKLNDTPYELGNVNIELDQNCFIPLKLINELRREAISKLDEQRIKAVYKAINETKITPQKCDIHEPVLTVEVTNEKQYQVAQSLGIKHIYFHNKIRRNNTTYPSIEGEILVNGYGGIGHYLKTNDIVTDSSLNITNHVSVAVLSSLGVKRITLSQEINYQSIQNLISSYFEEYKTYPNLELIIYGRSKIMHSKYCPLKRVGLCGKCKEKQFGLKDDYAIFPMLFNEDCTTTLLNSKPLNLLDEINDIKGINYFRLEFTTETEDETKEIISMAQESLTNKTKLFTFKQGLHTRGHFNNNPL